MTFRTIRVRGTEWKRTVAGSEDSQVLFWNDKSEKFLKIEKVYFIIPKMGNKRGEGWRATYNFKKLFVKKSKAAAIKSAKLWMKKHPRG